MRARNRIAVTAVLVSAFFGCSGERTEPDLGVFRNAADAARHRSLAAIEDAKQLVVRDATAPGNPGRYDSRSIRFEDRVAEAVYAEADGSSSTTVRADAVVWRESFANGGETTVTKERRLEMRMAPISSSSVGALQIRAAAGDNRFVRLRAEVGNEASGKAVSVRVDVIADGSFHDYVIDLRGALDRDGDWPVDRCVVALESGSEATVSSVELLDRSWKFAAPWGAISERLGGETRPGVYLRGEGTLTWTIDGRWRDARLSFALAEVSPGRRARIQLWIDGETERRPVADAVIVGGEGWTEFSVEVGAVDLDGATLSLSVEQLSGAPDGGVIVWASPTLWEPPEHPLKVLVLLEDALRADRMSIYGHRRATTPYKDRFFAESVRFERCIAQSTKTRFSCPSFMTSLRPLANGVYGVWNRNPRLAVGYWTMAEVFADRGWATASFLQNSNAGPDAGLDQGFDRVVENIPGRAEGVYGGPVLEWLERNRERNAFGYLHVADPHEPYDPPTSTRGWYEAILTESGGPQWDDPLWLQRVRRALYDGEVANSDAALAELVEHLNELGVLEHTIIVFIADHGEHLGEHDLWDHVPPSYMQVIRVPMLVRLPSGVGRRAVVEQPVQLLDLMPTLLELADIDAARLPFHGRSLLSFISGGDPAPPAEMAVVQEAMLYLRPDDPKNVGSLVWDRWHFLNSDKVASALFDHRADVDEERPLVPTRVFEEEALALLADLRRMDDELRHHMISDTSTAVEIDLINIANLEALGYLDE